MDIVVTLLLLVAGILFLIVMSGLFLPSTWVVEKAELVNAQPRDIFPMINNLKQWENWTVWYSKNGDINFEYDGIQEGEGSVQKWTSQRINGRLFITKSIEDEQTQYKFHIKEGQLVLVGTIVLAAADPNFTQVAWRCELEPLTGNNPIRRFQAYFIKSYFEKAIEDSLLSLQSIFANE